MYKILLLCLIFFQFSLAQLIPRSILRGQIVSTEVQIENVEVFNKNSNKGAITDAQGFYTLYAKPKDTLVFQSVQIKPVSIVLEESDFKLRVYKVELNMFINELNEVVITPKSLTGDLAKDAKNIKIYDMYESFDSKAVTDQMYTDDAITSPQNVAMPNNGTITYGMNFVAIGKLVKDAVFGKSKKKSEKIDYEKASADLLKEKFTYTFFTETLELKPEQIEDFLQFCEKDPEFKKLMAGKQEFYITEFLINKRKGFK